MLLLSQLTGTWNSRQSARAYAEAGWLAECHHSLAWSRPPGWRKLLPRRWRALVEKRVYPEIPDSNLRRHPMTEFSLRAQGARAANHRFDLTVARRLHRLPDSVQAVHGYFDTSLHTFLAAKQRGLKAIYELPTPYWRAVETWLEPERQRRPEWSASLPSTESLRESGGRRDEELQLADAVIVPSELVRDSLQLAPPFNAPVHIIPYGCPDVPSPISDLPSSAAKPPLRLLFAGTLSQSKGLADLIEAVTPLGDRVTLSIAGSPHGPPPSALLKPCAQMKMLGQLPHERLLEEMRRHDVLVLPTLYEGLSLTLLEAMAAGMAVITTTRSGLAGLVEPDREALLLEPGQPDVLRNGIEQLVARPERRRQLGAAARAWAEQHAWARYRQELKTIVAGVLGL